MSNIFKIIAEKVIFHLESYLYSNHPLSKCMECLEINQHFTFHVLFFGR